MWNDAWRNCREQGRPIELAILNDDVDLPLGALGELSRRLRRVPDVGVVYVDKNRSPEQGCAPGPLVDTAGRTVKEDGLQGHAFMLKAELEVPYVDERLRWWYGDDDLAMKFHLAGYGVCRAVGIGCRHVGGGNQSGQRIRDELATLKEGDLAVYKSVYGYARFRDWARANGR
jgi:hypothetical protein